MNVTHKGPEPEYIKNLFGSISHGYDKANDVMTFGVARRWRKNLVKWSECKLGDKVLDCATGTGDLAIDFKLAVGSDGKVIGSDFCKEMLSFAPAKAKEQNLQIEFTLEDAMNLTYEDQIFDVASIAFGIRNVSNPVKALCEMARVCKSGGRVMILETGTQKIPVVGPFIKYYFKTIVPLLGGWVTGNRQAYEYLNNSSGTFPSGNEFVNLMLSTGAFSKVEFKSLMGGASFLYKGTVK